MWDSHTDRGGSVLTARVPLRQQATLMEAHTSLDRRAEETVAQEAAAREEESPVSEEGNPHVCCSVRATPGAILVLKQPWVSACVQISIETAS